MLVALSDSFFCGYFRLYTHRHPGLGGLKRVFLAFTAFTINDDLAVEHFVPRLDHFAENAQLAEHRLPAERRRHGASLHNITVENDVDLVSLLCRQGRRKQVHL